MSTRSSGRPSRCSTVIGVVRVEVLEQGELHVGEHERVVALRDEHRTGELDGVDGTPVDDARAAVHRVDADPRPGQLGERQAGHDLELDAGASWSERDRALGDRGTARHRVRHTSPCAAASRALTSSVDRSRLYADSRSGAAS